MSQEKSPQRTSLWRPIVAMIIELWRAHPCCICRFNRHHSNTGIFLQRLCPGHAGADQCPCRIPYVRCLGYPDLYAPLHRSPFWLK